MSQDFRDDTASSVGPENWYYACDHWPNICQYVHAWKGCSDLHCVDLFSVSQQITKAFRRQCYRSVSWDIKLDPTHDISTESGWYGVLELCLRLFLGFGTVYCSLVYLIGNSWIVLVSMLFRIILHSWASLQHILLTSCQGCPTVSLLQGLPAPYLSGYAVQFIFATCWDLAATKKTLK